jgi:hypothetical protein
MSPNTTPMQASAAAGHAAWSACGRPARAIAVTGPSSVISHQ